MNFKESLDFRYVRPKSKCQDRVFNTYWKLKQATPQTVFKNRIISINEDEKNVYIEKTMQEKMKLYKFPQINWDNKNPSNFLSHVGGNKFNMSQTMSKITTRPVSSLAGFYQSPGTAFKKSNKNRPITAFYGLSSKKETYLKRPNASFRKKGERPKTALNLHNRRTDKMDSINEINSPSLIFVDTNNIIKEKVPERIRNKIEEKIRNDYKYKDEFFNELSKENLLDNTEEMNEFFKNSESKKQNKLSLGIISTYGAQAEKIKKSINLKKLTGFRSDRDERPIVSTVDDFQGDERDIIFVSMVRNNRYDKGTPEFIKNYQRINVALSRARRMLVVVGNRDFLIRKGVINLPDLYGRADYEQKGFRVYEKIITTIERDGKILDSNDILARKEHGKN